MAIRLLITALALAVVTSSFAQSTKEMREGRQRGWDARQVQRWIEFQPRSMARSVNEDCPDLTARRDVILNGNKITTQIFNFGSISAPGNTITDIVWNGLGYGYEFGPFVGAEIVDENRRDPQSVPRRDANDNVVVDAQGDTVYVMHIISDGLVSNGGELSPDSRDYWGWQPIPCAEPVGSFAGLQVVNPNSDKIPTSDARDNDLDGKPDSWPDSWYNENLERFVWPGALQQGASNADQEALYFMNDYHNEEFHYFPFSSDTTKRGLGLEVETRLYQWANPLAEDAIFLIYKITNKSEKDLDKVVFGMWGDPHVGGPANWQDDLAFFDRDLNMVYAWDDDGRSDIAGRPPGYFGYKFLESPGRGHECIGGRGANAAECESTGGLFFEGDGIDNDGDGMVDESWTDGIDNDGDWDPDTDDVGVDGIPGTGDEGEGDGLPTPGDPWDITKPGEPNFEFTDIDESDMIGLTSFASPPFAGNRISNDERVWDFVRPGRFEDVPEEPGDYVFLYGSGYFPLRAGETKRFSIALIVGENREDLFLNAEVVQQIYDVGYRFAKPPDKPIVTAVPGDRKVTLYWNADAENSIDPLTGENDFEGYVIYRSTDHEFSDQQTITDINGSRFLFRPLEDRNGVPARFDLANGIFGPSPIPFPRRGVAYDLGDETGLFHTYVDSNNVVNGQEYFYTVVAYDHGFGGDIPGMEGGIPPSETSKTITFNPFTDEYIFDVNTVSVTPRPRAAGYVPPSIQATGGIKHVTGTGTGDVNVQIVDEMVIRDENDYRLIFEQTDGELSYSVINDVPRTVEFSASLEKTSSLGTRNILPETFQLRTEGGTVLEEGTDYELLAGGGVVSFPEGSRVDAGEALVATFKHAPIAQSTLMNNEEGNQVFDGLHVSVLARQLALDTVQTGWISGGRGLVGTAGVASSGPGRVPQPYDYEIRFSNTNVSTSISTNLALPFTVVNVTRANQETEIFVPDLNRDGEWNLNEPIIFVEQINDRQTATWQVRLSDPNGTGARPGEGDVFFVRTHKPFTTNDTFTFRTVGARMDTDLARESLRDIYVVPNPYVATNDIEPRNPSSNTERGERRLYFANVPPRATIRIYTLAGELVDILDHDSTIDDGKVYWNLRTVDNMNIAYGLYIFHVDSPDGTVVGKFAVIK